YPGKFAAVLLISACIFQSKELALVDALKTTPMRCAIAITALAVLSIPASYWPKASFDFLINEWPLILLLGLCVTAGFANHRTAIIGLAAFTIAAGVGSLQLLLGAGLSVDGRLYIGDAASTTYDPNYSAAFFVMALPYAVMFASRRGRMRWIGIAVIPCITIAIVKTGS